MICVYTKDCERLGPMDVAHTEIIIEFKWHQSDNPFCEPYPLPGDLNWSTFLCDNKTGHDTLGQITSYVAAQLGSQFRTHIYSVLIVKDYARLIQWDQTGTIVTEAIRDSALAEFFRRYRKVGPEVNSVNTTVTVPAYEEICLARKSLDLVENVPLMKITVPAGKSEWSYIAHTPKAEPYTPPGRATCRFVAYDLWRQRMCLSRTHGEWTCEILRRRARHMRSWWMHKSETFPCVVQQVTLGSITCACIYMQTNHELASAREI